MNEITIYDPKSRIFQAKMLFLRILSVLESKKSNSHQFGEKKRTISLISVEKGQKIDIFV